MKNHLIIIKCHLNYLKLTSYEINIKWNAFFCYCGKPRIFFYCYDICHRKTSCVFCKNYGDCDYRNSIWYGKLKIWTFHVRHFQDKKNFNLDLSHNKMSLISCKLYNMEHLSCYCGDECLMMIFSFNNNEHFNFLEN